jgi:ABC-type bacteriocin/lantibiotic exporter with double-glycine peptidase domain
MYKAVPTTLQMEAADCGAASLKMLLDYHDSFYTLEEVRSLIGTGNDGSTIGDIREGAKKLGLILEAKEIDIATLHKSSIPCILWWDHVHFVVYEGLKGSKESINDPAIGRRSLIQSEFLAAWTGVAIIATDFSSLEHHKSETIASNNQILNFILGKATIPVILGLLLNILGIIPDIILSQLTSYFTEYVLISNQISLAKSLLWSFFALTGVSALLTTAGYYLTSRATYVTGINSSLAFLKLILKLPAQWHSGRNPQEIASRVLLPSQMLTSLTYSLVSSTGTIIKSILILIFIFAINPTLGSIYMTLFLLVFSVTLWINNLIKDANQTLSVDNGKQQGVALMTLSSLEKIRVSGEENSRYSTWAGYYTNFVNAQQKISLGQSYSNLASISSTYLCLTILIVFGPILIIKGKITIGNFIGLQFLLGYLSSGISAIPSWLADYQSAVSPITRIRDVFEGFTGDKDTMVNSPELVVYGDDYHDQVRNPRDQQILTKIKFNALSFSYRKGKPLFDDLNLEIDPHKLLCLTGKPGSGLTTFLKLLSGQLTPTTGTIDFYADSVVSERNRNNIRYFNDDPALLDIDIASNISLLKSDYSRDDIINALKSAGLIDYIKLLPKGIYSNLPCHGSGLSNTLLSKLIVSRIIIDQHTFTVIDTFIDQLPQADAVSFLINLKKRAIGCLVVSNTSKYSNYFDDIIQLN